MTNLEKFFLRSLLFALCFVGAMMPATNAASASLSQLVNQICVCYFAVGLLDTLRKL